MASIAIAAVPAPAVTRVIRRPRDARDVRRIANQEAAVVVIALLVACILHLA